MKIAILGMLAMDLVAGVERLPRAGEAVPSSGLRREPGGTGARQALAAARLGAEVTLCGRVGADSFGEEILALLCGAGVNVALVERVSDVPTGVSLVLAGPQHRLAAHAPGANGTVDERCIARLLAPIREAEAVLVDPSLSTAAVAALLRGLPPAHPVILYPLPASEPPPLPWERVRWAVGTSDRLALLTGGTANQDDAARYGQPFLARGVQQVVVTASGGGAYLVEAAGVTQFPGSGARGEADPAAFTAALAVKLAQGRGLYEAVGFASAAAALADARGGATPVYPTAAEVHESLSRSVPGRPVR